MRLGPVQGQGRTQRQLYHSALIDRSKPLLWPELTKIGREPYRLQTILQIRNSIKPELVVLDSPDKRAELVIRYYMRENETFGAMMRQILYDQPDFFRKANLTSPDTILRDSRELEQKGYFQKAEDVPATVFSSSE